MNRYLTLLFGSFLALHTCQVHGQAGKKTQDNKSLLWKITGKGMQSPSYLFGTMHLLCREDYLWTPAMEKSLLHTEEVCFEMNMDDPTLQIQIAMGMLSQDGKMLQDYFSQEDYAVISRFIADSLAMDISMLQQMKPAALLTLFASRVVSCTDQVSYEALILEKARLQQQIISGLETAQEQIALLDNMPGDSVATELLTLAKDYQHEKAEYSRMLEAYKQQDIIALHELIMENRDNGGADMNLFVDQRNIRWIERIEEKMEQRSVFFAVGAGHLWGSSGLIPLLQQCGYTVVPVK